MSRQSGSPDELTGFLRTVDDWCTHEGILRVPGWLKEPGNVPLVIFHADNSASGDPLSQCLQCAKSAGARLAIVNIGCLPEKDVEIALDRVRNKMEDSDQTERLAAIEACRSHVGQVSILELRFYMPSPPMILCYEMYAEWFEVVYGAGDAGEGEDDDLDDEKWEEERRQEEEKRRLEKERLDELTRKVASDPKFWEASNRGQREYAARRVLKGEPDVGGYGRSIARIAKDAEAIFTMDYLPAMEDDVMRLHGEGLSAEEIAAKVKLPIKRIIALVRAT